MNLSDELSIIFKKKKEINLKTSDSELFAQGNHVEEDQRRNELDDGVVPSKPEKSLYESSLAFGIRTSLSDTHQRKNVEIERRELFNEIEYLEKEVEDLQSKN